MSIQNILVLTALISLGTHNVIQAETIRGTEIPELNVTGILGEWYVLVSANNDDQIACTTMSFEQQSEDTFTMNSTFIATPEAVQKSPTTIKESYSLVFNCKIDSETNIITCDKGIPDDLLIVLVFDVDYESYLAMYTTSTVEKVASGNDGYVFILGRRTTLPDGILEKVKQTDFYQQGMKPGTDLYEIKTSGCH